MPYRKHKKSAVEWKSWVQRHRAALVECGLSEDVYRDRNTWHYFLDHGNISSRKEWHWFSLERLTFDQRLRLHDFLQAEYREDVPFALELLRSILPDNNRVHSRGD
jgi:hypothetical protein